MASKRERRAQYAETKRLNKPGRVGSFAEFEKEQNEGEREPKRERTERQDVKVPGAALLITIGLFVLYLAASGNLAKIGQAWDFILGKTGNLPTSGVGNSPTTGIGIHDFSNYHVETHLMQPSISVTNPGGVN